MVDKRLLGAIAVTRFGLGARVGEIDDAARDPVAWVLDQSDPSAAPIWPGALHSAELMVAKRAHMKAEPDETKRRDRRVEITHAEFLRRMQHACATPAPFRERWALFWQNHFALVEQNLEIEMFGAAFMREVVDPHLFGRFEDMAVAAVQHPAMLLALDQVSNVGPNSPFGRATGQGLNENLARELLELHTLGVDGGYGQTDVTEMARAISGWRVTGEHVPTMLEGRFVNDADRREPGVRRFMGRPWSESDDRAEAMVRFAARQPATARHIGLKLARHFSADQPPPALVRRLAEAFERTGGDLRAVAEALVTAPEAWSREQRKFKSPYDFAVSMHRATGVQPTDANWLNHVIQSMGHHPLWARTPEGWSDEAVSWATPHGLASRTAFAVEVGRKSDARDSRVFAEQALGPLARRATHAAVGAVGLDRPSAFALVLMSPEFQRR
jgi:uncharacterized protein (DUF1800 family)